MDFNDFEVQRWIKESQFKAIQSRMLDLWCSWEDDDDMCSAEDSHVLMADLQHDATVPPCNECLAPLRFGDSALAA